MTNERNLVPNLVRILINPQSTNERKADFNPDFNCKSMLAELSAAPH